MGTDVEDDIGGTPSPRARRVAKRLGTAPKSTDVEDDIGGTPGRRIHLSKTPGLRGG
jgi:hypothetical protein